MGTVISGQKSREASSGPPNLVVCFKRGPGVEPYRALKAFVTGR